MGISEDKKGFGKQDTLLMKGLAILLMLFYHLFESKDLIDRMGVNYDPLSENTLLLLSGYGNICVAIFALLSAYGITKGLMSEEQCPGTIKDFYQKALRRCLKLVGNFVVMYLSVNLLWFSKFDYAKLYGKGWQGGMFALFDMLGLAQILDTPTLNMTWWYMEIALFIIFAVPILYLVTKRMGKYTLAAAFLLLFTFNMNMDIYRYFLVIVLGVAAAEENWFEKACMWKMKKYRKLFIGTLLFIASILFRQNYMVHTYFLWLVDGPIALFLCWYGTELFGSIKGLSGMLVFLGKHSMNIFFVHTFFYLSIYQPQIYVFRYAAVIYIVLLVICVVYSVMLEGIKYGVNRAWRWTKGRRK